MSFTVAQWSYTRKKLKPRFERMGITRCEMCGIGNYLSFAHRLKRRFILTKEELETVALLCTPCHTKIEHSGHDEMYQAVTKIIENRGSGYR
jgi:hypothetical protein